MDHKLIYFELDNLLSPVKVHSYEISPQRPHPSPKVLPIVPINHLLGIPNMSPIYTLPDPYNNKIVLETCFSLHFESYSRLQIYFLVKDDDFVLSI